MPGHAELCFLNFCVWKREETNLEKIFRLFNDFVIYIGKFNQKSYVILTLLVLSAVGFGTIIILLIRIIRWMHRPQGSNKLSKSPAITIQGDSDLLNHNQTPQSQSSTYPLTCFASQVTSSTSLSLQKRASCNNPLFKRARFHHNYPKIVEPSLAKFSGSVEEEEPELTNQSIEIFSPAPCVISKGEIIDESKSCSSSQNQFSLLRDLDQSKDQVQRLLSSWSLKSNQSTTIQLNFVNRNQTSQSQSSIFPSSGFGSIVPSKLSMKIFRNSLSESTSLSQPKRAFSIKVCSYPPFKRAKLYSNLSKIVESSLANTGSAKEEEPALIKQSIIKVSQISRDISKGEVINKSNSCSSFPNLDQSKTPVETLLSSTSLQSSKAIIIQQSKIKPDKAKPSCDNKPGSVNLNKMPLNCNQRRKKNHKKKDYVQNINDFGDSGLVSHPVARKSKSIKIFDPGESMQSKAYQLFEQIFSFEFLRQCCQEQTIQTISKYVKN